MPEPELPTGRRYLSFLFQIFSHNEREDIPESTATSPISNTSNDSSLFDNGIELGSVYSLELHESNDQEDGISVVSGVSIVSNASSRAAGEATNERRRKRRSRRRRILEDDERTTPLTAATEEDSAVMA
eukprot:CAMPEP_0202451176 /NCGR_PEP_ID=MMETSP1360-20130828/9662_1 /ASSEMBLY_ACC=CAM_ASM_000848 /TAXON_ID=515479 /ORGANISM="Licmophora paradoxa, Strain CCMP2313" /LENGTH=128 /DNA_ID=CAMNT_0049069679 /DNA_START=121 /DNA_END=507 /DNA_ORIENTATION=-